jgi:hypothetical protein
MPDEQHDISEPLTMPKVDKSQQLVIKEYLLYMSTRLYTSLNSHLDAAVDCPTKQLRGQIEHLKRQIGVIDWLLTINDQRKVQDGNR